jgi:hypothetical protein
MNWLVLENHCCFIAPWIRKKPSVIIHTLLSLLISSSWWWRQQAPLKCRSVSVSLHDAASQNSHLHTRSPGTLKSYIPIIFGRNVSHGTICWQHKFWDLFNDVFSVPWPVWRRMTKWLWIGKEAQRRSRVFQGTILAFARRAWENHDQPHVNLFPRLYSIPDLRNKSWQF